MHRAPASVERSETAPDPSWLGLSKSQVAALSRRVAQAQRAAALAAYRGSHEVAATMSDATVWALMMIEQIGKPSPAATAVYSREESNP